MENSYAMEMSKTQGKKIIAVVGMPGVGKSTVVNLLVKKYQLPYIHFGGITMEEIRRRNMEETQENEKKIRQELRDKHGMAAYAHLSLPKITKLLEQHDHMLIDGLYSWSEYILLRKAGLDLAIVSIICKRKNRYRRLANREYRPLTYESAEARDFAEIESLEKGGPIALCDYYITNDGEVAELEKAVYNLAIELELKTTNS